MKQSKLLLAILALTLGVASVVSAQTVSSPRYLGMGNAITGLAGGADAALINPANLGLSGHKSYGLQFFGVGAQVTNNAFTLDDYNAYTGAFLDDEDKEAILNDIPGEGLTVRADVGANAMSIALGSLVLSTTAAGAANMNVSKDVFELALYGNAVGDTISVTGTYSEAVGYGAANLSYGTTIYKNGSRELSVGLTAKYLRGLGVQRIIENTGTAVTNNNGFAGQGSVVIQTATGGSGYALDLGAGMNLNRNYTISACFHNVISKINWNKETTERGFLFDFDSMTVENNNEDYVITDDYEKSIPSFSTSLPAEINIGFARTTGRLLWAVEWEQGFKTAPGASTTPRFGIGTELRLIPFMPLRAGASAGGGTDPTFSAGTGLHVAFFYIDVAGVTNSGIGLESAKGIQFAVASGLKF